MVRSEGNMSLKNLVRPPGIDPGIVRLLAQRLNPYATPGPHFTNNTGQQNLTFFMAHEEKYLILLELLKLNSNV